MVRNRVCGGNGILLHVLFSVGDTILYFNLFHNRRRRSPMSFQTFFMQKVPNLHKRRKSRGLVGHDLENRRHSDFDAVDFGEFSSDYSEYREELLADRDEEDT